MRRTYDFDSLLEYKHLSRKFDCLGQEIFVGNIVCLAEPPTEFFSGGIFPYLVYYIQYDISLLSIESHNFTVLSILQCNNTGQNIRDLFVLKNPLFHIENENIKNLLKIQDGLKSRKLFPETYRLGDSISVYKTI
jgi:hypothetical protein